MRIDKPLPDPWPEDLYWFDLLDSYPVLVRYSNFYSFDFSKRVGCLHLWYYGKHHSQETTPELLLCTFDDLLTCAIKFNQDREATYGRNYDY
jgi:hypothetical protein